MPCNAVATARAQVSQEKLAALLTDELVSNVLYNYLKQKYSHLNPREQDTWLSKGVAFVIGNFRIYVECGRVSVSTLLGRTAEEQVAVKHLADDVTAFLTKTAGLIFQQKTRLAVASRYAISEEQRAPNGALVLSVEL